MKQNKENKLIIKLKHIINYNKYRMELLELKDKGEITEKEFKDKTLKVFIDTIIFTLAIIIIPTVIFFSGYTIVKNIDEKKQIAAEEARLAAQVEVPDVLGMTIDEARETLNKVGLEISLTDYDKKLTESNPNEYVVESQYPSAKKKVDKNTEIKVFFKELKVLESNNFYGMRFNKTISEFCETYNKNLTTIYERLGENTSALFLDELKEKDFTYYQTTPEGLRQYNAIKLSYGITLFLEENTDYIVFACVGQIVSASANPSKTFEFVTLKVYPNLVMSLTGSSYTSVIDLYEEIAGDINTDTPFFENNVAYYFPSSYWYVHAMSEDKYNEMINNTGESSNNTQNEIDSTTNEEINNAISYLNTEYDLGLTPTQEQMNEIIEFYNTTEDFNNDKLLEFILQKGWTVRGTSEPDPSAPSTSSSSNSNKNNSNNNSSKNNNTSKEEKEITATLNINLKELIAKNETAKEIKEKYPTIFIHVYVEDAFVKDELFEYYSGGQSIPNTINTQIKVSDFYDKDITEKRKVTITMDNTSTMLVQTTLFEGEMTFDKSGTYEIK